MMCKIAIGPMNPEDISMEQESFERKIMNCILVLLKVRDQINRLEAAVPHMKAHEAHERLEMRRNELTEKRHCLETELSQLQAAQRESKGRGSGAGEDLLHPRSS
jgi:predicted  nucleic acid-binding Zn-ribbon protein